MGQTLKISLLNISAELAVNKTITADVKTLVFAKAPVSGKCKTRLIPALGANAAAQLHQNMIRYSLATLKNIKDMDYELWRQGLRLTDAA